MKILRFFLISSLLVSCSKNQIVYKKLQGQAFGTTYSIIYEGQEQVDYKKSIDSIIEVMNQSLSTYRSDSDISKINSGDLEVIVDENFKEVFEKSRKIHTITGGFFDPTVGTLVNAWGFGPKNSLAKMDSLQIDSLMHYVGFEKVSIDHSKVVKSNPNISFDFNAIAKGFGIDLIARFFENHQIANYLIEVGGEIRCKGMSDKGQLWNAGIESPNTDGSRSLLDVVSLSDESMATSGNYRKFKIDSLGNKYVHTINPKTGWAVPSNLLSVSVIAKLDCADVDAYATTFMAMGKEQTLLFLGEHPELKAYLIYLNESGGFEGEKVNFD